MASPTAARRPVHHPAHHCAGAASFRKFAANVWAPKRWRRRGSPAPGVIAAERRRLARARGCGYRGKLKADWKRDKLRFGRYRAFRKIAPYPGGGTYWAIPWCLVYAESRGDWMAANPSGAVGPYELLGWGAPYPARTWKQKMENHRIAAKVWAGGAGASNWVTWPC